MTPDAAAVRALVDDLRRLRLSLSADMEVLAASVELRAFEIADDVVDGEQQDLAAFADRAGTRLAPAYPPG
jgi:hypothetical protein